MDRSLPPDDDAPRVIYSASTTQEAQVVLALLRGNGIPAHVDGEFLVDEFSMAQNLTNTAGVEIRVPAAAFDDAQKVLEAARQAGRRWDDPNSDDPDEMKPRRN